MSSSSMAPNPSSSWSPSSTDIEKPDFESIRALIISVNQYIVDFLAKDETWRLLKLRCISRCAKQDYFECSDQSVFSNLCQGIKSIEAAIQATRQEERTSHLRKSEEMLQVPALLDEYGFTAGIPNHYLISFSYFYLSVVRKLCRDKWQVVLHFLQAVLVSPSLARIDCAPELCASLFPSRKIVPETQEIDDISHTEEDSVDEDMRQMARRYKHWLMYYQVMSYGQTPNWHCMDGDITSHEDEPKYVLYERASIGNSSNSMEHKHSFPSNFSDQKVHPFNNQKFIMDMEYETKTSREASDHPGCEKALKGQTPNVQAFNGELATNFSIKCLHDMLKESQSDTPTSEDSSIYYFEENDSEANIDGAESSISTARRREYDPQQQVYDQTLQYPCFASAHMRTMTLPHAPQHSIHEELSNVNVKEFLSDRFLSSIGDSDLSTSDQRERNTTFSQSFPSEDELAYRTLQKQKFQMSGHKTSTSPPTSMFTHLNQQGRAKRKMHSSHNHRKFNEAHSHPGQGHNVELLAVVERAISKLCFSEGVGKCEREYAVEVTSIYKMLNQKTGETYAILKDMILDQLLMAISTSKKEKVVRASVSTLTTIISVNKSAVEEIKKKGLRLCDLASALKRNVHEAAILIYLINPAPIEIKSLELLPTLVELVCTSNGYKGKPAPPVLTPPSASLMIIEVLVTAFDYTTNNTHLAAINTPHILSRLLDVARSNSVEENVSLATILVKCMQFDGRCRKYISQFTTVAPFICLLQSDQKRAKFIALEYFHEILRMPRSSAISLLQRIRNEGGTDILHILALCVWQLQPNYQLLAANLLLQLDTVENQKGNGEFVEETIKVILKLLASEESSTMQLLSAFILSNMGGTYSWTGEPYTVAWLVKKTGLTSPYHRNMIKNYEWSEESLEDAGIDSWSSKIAKSIIEIGSPVFRALEKGLKSETKNVSRDSLTTIAWLGYEIARSSNSLRSSACKVLLSGIEQFLHPGVELEERLLACLCIYNYASGKGMKKLIHFTEGVRESLRRFSSVTWMAEELHRVAEYSLPNKSRISCVHTQILEASSKCSGAVTALIYYKGLLHSGYSDGSIKVWEIKKQSSTLVWDRKEHKKAVTCFALFEPGESLLSGSSDKSIRVWQMVEGKLECIEVISMKEPIQQMETCKQIIFVVTQGHKIKVFDSQRTVQEICKHKKVKCMRLAQGKAYLGCTDSSIKELTIRNNQEREIKAPSKSWRMQSKPIHSLFLYKDWLYSASSSIVEGSNLKEWRRQSEPQMSIVTEKGRNILAIAVVEDFVYLTCSSSTSILQIWLRGTQQKVGRISAGSRITSLLTGNDTVICGTEKGLIKGWIPL
ncbi:putative E3 ubiquitin-protein ligase LIN-1 [Tripterygium wilfordii]|uniref:putative E3 ubiquitin-protein ligase LIN-1 n=1 Tax=Tripterygium wilfordii TaxID=458696 RepID=UPI0018F7EC4E|nr:putative E3 ubiquitin-protein ligase LIN-1 [Tripterygium wilfordii]